MTNKIPILYILMRNDLESLNPGKAMAQASHATSHFTRFMEDPVTDNTIEACKLYSEWSETTNQYFGTVLTLAVEEKDFGAIQLAAQRDFWPCEIIHDPTYPIRDGKTCHHIALNTCMYVFTHNESFMAKNILKKFPLYD